MNTELFLICQLPKCRQVYEDPVILPCCFESICQKHVREFITEGVTETVTCPFCKDNFDLPAKGLPLNKKLIEIIKMDLGPLHKETKENFKEFESSLKRFHHIQNEPDCFVFEYFHNIKNQMDLNKEELKSFIDGYYEELLNQITNCQNACIPNTVRKDPNLLNHLYEQRQKWEAEISKFIIDDYKWKKLSYDIKEKLNELKFRINQLVHSLLNNNTVKFEKGALLLTKNKKLLGEIIEESESAMNHFLISSSYDKSVKVWDLKNSKYEGTFILHAFYINDIKSITNQIVVSCCSDKTIKVWNINTGESYKAFHTNRSATKLVRYKYDKFLSGHEDGGIRLWNIFNDSPMRTYRGHTSQISGLEVIFENLQLVSLCINGVLMVWNIETTESLKEIHTNSLDIYEIKVLPNLFEIIACRGNGKISKFDLIEESYKDIFQAHNKRILTIELLPNNRLATGSEDKTIKIWELDKFQCLHSLNNHTDQIRCLKYLSKNKLISGSDDNSIKIWSLANYECIQTLNGHSNGVWHLELVEKN